MRRGIRAARLVSGLALMAFVACHLLVVAGGLVSIVFLERLAGVLMAPWTTMPGTALVMGSAGIHLVGGLVALAERRSLALRLSDWVQLVLGLAVVPLLVPHVLTVRLAGQLDPALGIDFPRLLAFYWQEAPGFAIQQLIVVVVVWIHASIGLYGWGSLQAWWPRAGKVLTPALFAVPILALLGFVEAGKATLARLDADPAFAADIAAQWSALVVLQPQLQDVAALSRGAYAAALALALAALAVRLARHRNLPVTVSYEGGLTGSGRRGLTILEISRLSHVPHASLCSGRGRCGTCRVRVTSGLAALSPKDETERRTLGPGQDRPEYRLACRARVFGPGVGVERLMPVDVDASAARRPQDWMGGTPSGAAVPALARGPAEAEAGA